MFGLGVGLCPTIGLQYLASRGFAYNFEILIDAPGLLARVETLRKHCAEDDDRDFSIQTLSSLWIVVNLEL